jgi:hypothetical protein
MRRFLGGARWIFKRVLVLIALTAAGLWILGIWHRGSLALHRYAVETERVDAMGFAGWFEEGRIGFGLWRDHYTEGWLVSGQQDAQSNGRGWHWKWEDQRPGWIRSDFKYHLGSVHWDNFGWRRTGIEAGRYVISAPNWLILLLAGAWPVYGLAGRLRSRLEARRRARMGRCRFCGYDLRATPAGDGALLEQCPECGAIGGKKRRSESIERAGERDG